MIIKAEQKNTRQPARKIRLVSDVVKGMSIEDAIRHLAVINRKSSLVVLKVLRQAVANAVNNFSLALQDLEIDNIVVNDGPVLKRWRAVSRGRAHTILKRTSHVMVNLKTKATAKPVAAVKKAAAKVEVVKEEDKKEVKTVAKATKKAQSAIKLDSKARQSVKAVSRVQGSVKSVQTQKKGSK